MILGFLTACEDTKEYLGLNNYAPDEFVVVQQRPLDMPPPDYTMEKPRPGDVRPQYEGAELKAKRLLLQGEKKCKMMKGQGIEEKFSAKISGEIDPEIREKVTQESEAERERKRSFTNKVAFWKDQRPGRVVDPFEERKRVQQMKGAS